jgi:hypothetical protein
MIKGGIGGSHTTTGLKFEKDVDFLESISKIESYSVQDNKVLFKNKQVAESLKKHELYRYLDSQGVDWKKLVSKKLLPDDLVYSYKDKTFHILEIKFQEVPGSTDEKLQTCDFKIKKYRKLLAPLGVKVKYIYILNNWFKKYRYRDVLEYIESIDGCSYYFNQIPFKDLGLPE